ncbi:DUF3995 domain-containing protein (plasmid) [Photobacterium sp. GJ3]|uniref:DUF3995 domain-containing protein n=1 Tax=Photobacterium sp. GJ3 TaxID=2829502 RepID=UPI001B8ADFF7|nr:DUF3995 domain-containing protein [Photobacterium sp. GJ3]QUJ70217.1 DUF3995 domain-containing protein [Photobacterium sp. GJ3]
MAEFISIFMAACLMLVSLIHVYWAFGGRKGIFNAIPVEGGERSFTPGAFITFVVAFGLFLFSILSLSLVGMIQLPRFVTHYLSAAGFIVSGIFFLRSLGDFRLVGFSKKVKGSAFATWDSWVYSPLCLLLGAGYFYLSFIR